MEEQLHNQESLHRFKEELCDKDIELQQVKLKHKEELELQRYKQNQQLESIVAQYSKKELELEHEVKLTQTQLALEVREAKLRNKLEVVETQADAAFP